MGLNTENNKISIIIPCYKSENSIGEVVGEIINVFHKHNDYKYEIILINDCSPDNVWEKIKEISDNSLDVIGVNLSKNFGQHSAIMAGLSISSGDIAISVDDDGQVPVDEVFKIINKLDEGYDVVYGIYKTHHNNKSFRGFGTFMNQKMAEWLLGKPKELQTTSFFAMRKFVIDEICRYRHPFPYLSGLILRTTTRIGMVEVDHRKRLYGKSTYSISSLLKLWLNGFTAFSVKPLRIASFIGGCCSVMGFLYGIVVIIKKIISPNVAIGYSSLMSVLLFVSGIIMLILGIMGEYIGRLYICMNESPQFVIRDIYGESNRKKNTNK